MTDRSVGTGNPLYEKLYNRFSYDGKTVGEMMLARAKEHAASHGKPTTNICDITAESTITKANFLPRPCAAETAIRRPAHTAFSLHRINPSAVLAIVLAMFIFVYLCVAGINHRTNFSTPDVISASAVEIESVAAAEGDTLVP